MNFKESLRGIGNILLAVLAGAVGFVLLTMGMKGKQSLEVKEVEIDKDRIKADERKRIMDMPTNDFVTEYPGVGDAATRGKKRFADRVKRVLHQRGSNRNSTEHNEDSGGRN